MSRRDTIIVAVLINAGLLIVLFASALKSGDPADDFVAASKPAVEHLSIAKLKPAAPVAIGDEVDMALSQYNAPVQPVKPVVAAAPAFAEELKFVAPVEVNPAPVAATAPARPVEKQESLDHRVKKGDMLEKIARQHHCSVDQIMKLNQLTTTNLRIGQVLKIPASGEGVASGPVAEEAPKFYVVKNGDNPWTIAVKNHMKVDELLKLNDLNEEKARRLKPGDQLRIR